MTTQPPAPALAHFAGGALCHTDPNLANVLVGQGRTWLVDWAWASRGARTYAYGLTATGTVWITPVIPQTR